MKVVLFCGGQGTRLRDYSETIPKPLVEVGAQPILWHLMKYYAHYGHKEFVLCLGHGAAKIKEFFLRYDECVANDFIIAPGGRGARGVSLLRRDIDDWRITFIDTGISSSIGERLRRVREHLGKDEMFLANYADGLSDLDLAGCVESFRVRDKIASFVSVPAPHTFHIVQTDADNHVTQLEAVAKSQVRINGGFFVLRREIFEYMRPGEDLVLEPFERLIEKRQLLAVPYDGFWRNMDTFKDKMVLDELLAQGRAPWQVWQEA
jgi:glucose-1-phosphate cytidylyltransferase